MCEKNVLTFPGNNGVNDYVSRETDLCTPFFSHLSPIVAQHERLQLAALPGDAVEPARALLVGAAVGGRVLSHEHHGDTFYSENKPIESSIL